MAITREEYYRQQEARDKRIIVLRKGSDIPALADEVFALQNRRQS